MEPSSPLLDNLWPSSEDSGDYSPVRSWGDGRRVLWLETVKVWKIGAPIAMQLICYYGINAVTIIFVGHIGETELSAVSIALSVIGTFSFGFLLGMGSALETLCGQAVGAGRIHMLGIYLQRSWIILFVGCIILTPIYVFATPILELLGQEHDISKIAGRFTILTLPQLFSLAITFPTQKFLQAQSKVMVLLLINMAAILIHVGILWLFIYVFGWGVTGAAVGFDITSWGVCVAQFVYTIVWCNEGWSGFSLLAFKDLWAFVRLSIASAVMLCLEAWYFMLLILLAGYLKNAVVAVGSLSICTSLTGWETMLFLGVNAAIGVRVSNELGLGHPRAAKYSVYVTVSESALLGLLFMVAVIVFRDYYPLLYTSSKELQVAASKLAYLLGITMLLNSIQPVLSGVAIGGGWQALVAYINLGCYYGFGLPLGCILGYVAKLGVPGLWGGMICGTALQTVLLVVVVARTNWNKEVNQTSGRMRKWGGKDYIDALTTVGTSSTIE